MSTHQADPEIRIPDKTKDECNILTTLCDLKRGKRPKYLEFKDCDGNGINVSCAAEGNFNLNEPGRYISKMKIFKNVKTLKLVCNMYELPFGIEIRIIDGYTVEHLLIFIAKEFRNYINFLLRLDIALKPLIRQMKEESGDPKKSKEESKSGDSKKSEEERNIGDFNIWGIRQKSGEEWEVFLSKAESPVPRPEYVSPQDLILDPKLYCPFGQVDTDLNSTPKVDKATRKKRKYIEDTTEEVHVEKGKASRNNKGRKKVRFENP